MLVRPQNDACNLCLKFENVVISLEEYDNKYITMSEAISKGYHHLGCTHIDEDFYPWKSKISDPFFSRQEQIRNYQIKLQKFKLEDNIRNLKFQIQNISNIPKNTLS